MGSLDDGTKFHFRQWHGVHIAEVFRIEFFAGIAVFCSVAKQHGMAQSYGVDKIRSKSVRSSVVTIDLTQQSSRDLAEFWLNSTLICWAHFAPVCGEQGQRN